MSRQILVHCKKLKPGAVHNIRRCLRLSRAYLNEGKATRLKQLCCPPRRGTYSIETVTAAIEGLTWITTNLKWQIGDFRTRYIGWIGQNTIELPD